MLQQHSMCHLAIFTILLVTSGTGSVAPECGSPEVTYSDFYISGSLNKTGVWETTLGSIKVVVEHAGKSMMRSMGSGHWEINVKARSTVCGNSATEDTDASLEETLSAKEEISFRSTDNNISVEFEKEKAAGDDEEPFAYRHRFAQLQEELSTSDELAPDSGVDGGAWDPPSGDADELPEGEASLDVAPEVGADALRVYPRPWVVDGGARDLPSGDVDELPEGEASLDVAPEVGADAARAYPRPWVVDGGARDLPSGDVDELPERDASLDVAPEVGADAARAYPRPWVVDGWTTEYADYGEAGVVKLYADSLPWKLARQRCERDGAHLLSVDTEVKVAALLDVFSRYPRVPATAVLKNQVYVGVNDRVNEGVFRTVTGEVFRPWSDGVWFPGEPDDVDGEEDCVTFHTEGKIRDVPCRFSLPFFCELDPSAASLRR